MKLNDKQKAFYADTFEDEDYLEDLRQRYNSSWEIIYDPKPNDYDYALIIDGLEWDRLNNHFVREIEKL